MKRLIAALLCVIMIALLLPVGATADYVTTTKKGEELVLPDADNYFKTPFWCNLFRREDIRSMFIMPMPETGHGDLGFVTTGSEVYVLGEQNGFFFFVTRRGQPGWAWREWFNYDKTVVSLEKTVVDEPVLYPTVSTVGTKLAFPDESEYLETPETASVVTETACGSIYLMPTSEKGHGHLGILNCGEEVTVLAKRDGMYFFQAADGRFGWNNESWFA